MNFALRWLTSRTVRRATDLQRQARRLINEQRDLLAPHAIQSVEEAVAELQARVAAERGQSEIHEAMAALISVADQNLHHYPGGAIRDNVKEFLVAAAVILAFTTFFLQLTKIPTGSMQPSLYGITHEDFRDRPEVAFPGRLARLGLYWFYGIAHYEVIAEEDGELRIDPPRQFFPFVKRQRLAIGGRAHDVWFPPEDLAKRAGLYHGQYFRAGEAVVRLKVVSGDHLLVDRFTYNFRRPERGEIIVFKTKGISQLVQDQLYIKRLVALPGETVRLGDDQHLRIDGERLDAATPRFENVYSFDFGPEPNGFFGHVNQAVASQCGKPFLSPLFLDETSRHVVGPRHYLALGDNTLNSLDSRAWGDLPQRNVIGKCWMVYWPFTERFGWGTR